MRAVLIPLTKGKVAQVDDGDAELVIDRKWHAMLIRGHWYAGTGSTDKAGKRVYMHRLLMPGAAEVDHINGDGLDNRRENLRSTTHALNLANQRPQVGRSSRFKGVSYNRRSENWQAYIKVNGRMQHLGRYTVEEDAARAYDVAAIAAWGEHAWPNLVSA